MLSDLNFGITFPSSLVISSSVSFAVAVCCCCCLRGGRCCPPLASGKVVTPRVWWLLFRQAGCEPSARQWLPSLVVANGLGTATTFPPPIWGGISFWVVVLASPLFHIRNKLRHGSGRLPPTVQKSEIRAINPILNIRIALLRCSSYGKGFFAVLSAVRYHSSEQDGDLLETSPNDHCGDDQMSCQIIIDFLFREWSSYKYCWP